jgi:hypothetical protein
MGREASHVCGGESVFEDPLNRLHALYRLPQGRKYILL